MPNLLEKLDVFVKEIYKGDIPKLRRYYDFIMLYLGRYENLYINSAKITNNLSGYIALNDQKDKSLVCLIVVKPEGVQISIKKSIYDLNDIEEVYVIEEGLFVNGNGFKGKIDDFVYDDSGIEYNNLPEMGEGTHYTNTGMNIYTLFTNKGIVDEDGKIAVPFSSNDNVSIFNELQNNHLDLKNEVYSNFYVDEFDVRSINILDSDEDRKGVLKDFAEDLDDYDNNNVNSDKMLNDKIISLYLTLCHESNIKENDFIINNINMIELILNRFNVKYYIEQEVYREKSNSYGIPVIFDSENFGLVVIKPDKISLKLERHIPNTDKVAEDSFVLNTKSYNGRIESINGFHSADRDEYIKLETIFNNYGIVDDVTVPFEHDDNVGRFVEIMEMHEAQFDSVVEEYSHRPCIIYTCFHQEISDMVNPETVSLRNGEVYYKKKPGRKK